MYCWPTSLGGRNMKASSFPSQGWPAIIKCFDSFAS